MMSPPQAAKIPLIARFLPSLTDLAFLLPLVFIFVPLHGARTLLGDGDTGWHVRTGEWILAHRQVPHSDIFSFSRPRAPWFAWEWLCDILYAVLHRRWGMAGVVLASIVVICLTSVALFRLILRKCDNGFIAIALTLLATGLCAVHWLARPHLFTILFLVWTLHITDRAAAGRTKMLAWLIPLTLLWTNVHAGFFVVFLVLACYIGSDLLNAAIERDAGRRRQFLRSSRPWMAAALACAAASLINPYGWELHRHVIRYITDPYQTLHIGEYQSMNFHAPVAAYFEPFMIAALLTAFEDARRRRFADVFLNLGWLHMALTAQRNLPLFAIAAAPLVARALTTAIAASRDGNLAGWIGNAARRFEASSTSFDRADRIPRVHLASVLPLLLTGLLLLAPMPADARFVSTWDPAMFPEGALPALRAPATRRIFAEDQWGDYLIYRLYPMREVFIDGRSDFYGDEFGERYLDVLNLKTGWDKTLDEYKIDTILLSPKAPLSTVLKLSREWPVVYDDGVSIVFRRAAR